MLKKIKAAALNAWNWIKNMWKKALYVAPLEERIKEAVSKMDPCLSIHLLVDIVDAMLERGVQRVGELNANPA